MALKSYILRALSMVLVFLMLLSSSVMAVDVEATGEFSGVYYNSAASSYSNPELEKMLEEAFEAYKTNVDIAKYGYRIVGSGNNISPDAELRAVVCNAVYDNPELFWASTGFSFSYDPGSGLITKLNLRYTVDKDEIPERRKAIDAELEKISSYIIKGMSDEEIALAVHDYFCTHYEYDQERLANGTLPHESYTIEGVLSYGIGVCQSYALAYEFVLDEFDVECTTVSSSAMNHMWNMIEIDDEWYHVDVTWDDPTVRYETGSYDMAGLASHEYFLISDETALTGRRSAHHSWENIAVECSSKRFENAVWADSDSSVVFDKKNMYVAEKNGDIVAVDRKNGDANVIYTVTEYWGAGGNSYYPNEKYTRLAMVRDRIYFTSDDEILSMSTKGDDVISEFTAEGDVAIFGMYEDDGKLIYAANVNLNIPLKANGEYAALPVAIKEVHLKKPTYKLGVGQRLDISADLNSGAVKDDLIWESLDTEIAEVRNNKIVPKARGKVKIKAISPDNEEIFDEIELEITEVFGDGDGDGKTNTKDAVMMAQCLAGWDVETSDDYKSLCDVYVDGVINTRDAVLIAQYLAGWEVSLGTPISE